MIEQLVKVNGVTALIKFIGAECWECPQMSDVYVYCGLFCEPLGMEENEGYQRLSKCLEAEKARA